MFKLEKKAEKHYIWRNLRFQQVRLGQVRQRNLEDYRVLKLGQDERNKGLKGQYDLLYLHLGNMHYWEEQEDGGIFRDKLPCSGVDGKFRRRKTYLIVTAIILNG